MLQDLNEAELAFVTAVSEGRIYETKHTINAELVRMLMLGVALPGKSSPVPTPCGIRLKGATIQGMVNLNNGRGYPDKIMPGLALEHCLIPDGIDVSYAELGKLSIEFSRISHVRAVRTVFHGEMIAKDIGPVPGQDSAHCYLDFRGAHVEGDLLLNRSVLREPIDEAAIEKRQYALSLRNAFINGTVYFREVDCEGTINLSMAFIEGNFTARGSRITPQSRKEALLAEDVKIKGGLLLRWVKRTGNRFTAFGRVNLTRAILGGAVFDRACIIDRGYDPTEEGDDVVNSIELENAIVEGGLYFRNGFRLEGSLGLTNVSVRTDVDLREANVSDGIIATAAKVGCAFRLDNARTGRDKWTDLSDTTVGTVLSVRCTDSHLDLRRASIKTYDDGCDAPEGRRLRLDGFLYERLESVGKRPKGFINQFFNTRRLDWLARQDGFRFKNDPLSVLTYILTSRSRLRTNSATYRPQPFIQLGRVLEAHGYDNDARKIWRMTEWMEWQNDGRWPVRVIMSAFGTGFGFGYSPARAIATVILFFLLGLGGYWAARYYDLLVYDPTPVQMAVENGANLAYLDAPTGSSRQIKCDIDPAALITDLMIPLVELHKSEKCDIREDLKTVQISVPASTLTWAHKHLSWQPLNTWNGQFPYLLDVALVGRILHTLYALLGWLVTSLAVLTFSGLLRQKSRAE